MLMLREWLDPATRKPGRYGPFTLGLPALAQAPKRADLIFRGDQGEILAAWEEGDPEKIHDWLKSGAGLEALDAEVFERLQGRGLIAAGDRMPRSSGSIPVWVIFHRLQGTTPELAREVRRRIKESAREAWTTRMQIALAGSGH